VRGFDVTTGRTRFQLGHSLDLRFGLERWIATPTGYLVDVERGTLGPRLECPGDNSVRDLVIAATLRNLEISPMDCVNSAPVVVTPDGRTGAYGVELVIRAKASCIDR